MKKLIAMGALGLLAAAGARAAYISPEAALARGEEALSQGRAPLRAPGRSQVAARLVYTASPGDAPSFYVYDYGTDAGFALFSADDRLPAVLGFVEEGAFDYAALPPNVKWWLDGYNSEIQEFYRTLGTDAAWKPAAMAPSRASMPAIAPMLKTKWNQGKPYNNNCPYDGSQRSVTGCVATALAQVMKYHEWPLNPQGTAGGVTFTGTTYDWANMLDVYNQGEYTTTEANAVAVLMRQCGAAVDMKYSAYESGATINAVQSALTDYFDYSKKALLLGRDYYSYSQWMAIVYNELAAKRPVFYTGQASTGGHAFVCDGYRSNGYFHFNWGWGGVYDGYFLLNALNPGTGGIGSHAGGYNYFQEVVTGIEKNDGGDYEKQVCMFSQGGFTWTGGNTFAFSGKYGMAYNPHNYTINVDIGVLIEGETDPSYSLFVNCKASSFKPYYGFSELSPSIPSSLPDGKYRIYPALRPTGSSQAQKIFVTYSQQTYVGLEMKNGSSVFSNENEEETAMIVYQGMQHVRNLPGESGMPIRFYMANLGERDWSGQFVISLHEPDDDYFVQDFKIYVNLPAGATSAVDLAQEVNFPAGSYVLDILDSDGITYAKNIPLTLGEPCFVNNWGSLTVSDITPNFVNASNTEAVSTTVGNSSSSQTVSNTFTLGLYNFEETSLMNLRTSEVSLEPYSSVPISSEPLDFRKYGAGDYFWAVSGQDGTWLSCMWPLKVISGPVERDGVSYYIEYESSKSAYVGPREEQQYEGDVTVPETADGYTIGAIQPGTFTFAGKLESLSLPSGVKELHPADLYKADALKTLSVGRADPFTIASDLMPENRFASVRLNTPKGSANVYKRTDVWKEFFMPAWTSITVQDGVTLEGGFVLDPDSNKPYAPYYVSDSDNGTLISASSSSEGDIYMICRYTDYDGAEKVKVVTFHDGVARLPELDGRTGTISIDTVGVDGVAGVLAENAVADIYDSLGRLVKANAAKADLSGLPAGVYIWNGTKVVR